MSEVGPFKKERSALFRAVTVRHHRTNVVYVCEKGAEFILRVVRNFSDETANLAKTFVGLVKPGEDAAVKRSEEFARSALDSHSVLVIAIDVPHRVGLIGVGPALPIEIIPECKFNAPAVGLHCDG